MASIIISGDTMKDVPEVNKMVNDLLRGKIDVSQFIKFLDDNDLETKVRCIDQNMNPSTLDDFIGETLFTLISVPKNSECEDDEIEEDNIEYAKAYELFHSMMHLGKSYRQRAIKGDERYNIPNLTPENILKFINSLDLPTDRIRTSLEKGKSNYYKMKIYKSFEEFEKNMKDAYGIENVWNTKDIKTPDWFESTRNMLYRKFYPVEDIIIDESEWNEFKKWKEEKKECLKKSKKTTLTASVKKNETSVKKTASSSKNDNTTSKK